jgi:DNA-binding response OmpR family regulator
MRQVLARRLNDSGWEHRYLPQPPSPRALVMMRLHALVLDLELLGHSRWDYLRQIVETLPELPIVLCTLPWPVADRVRALRIGAQDWIAKPYHPDELLARVESAVRARQTARTPSDASPIQVGELLIDPSRYTALVSGRDLELSRREFTLLHLLAQAGGQVLEREAIYRRVWGYEMAHGDRSVDVYVRKLRQKLVNASPRCRYIHTHVGIGYRLALEPSEAAPPQLGVPAGNGSLVG